MELGHGTEHDAIWVHACRLAAFANITSNCRSHKEQCTRRLGRVGEHDNGLRVLARGRWLQAEAVIADGRSRGENSLDGGRGHGGRTRSKIRQAGARRLYG
jgi:hypothetical protein